MNARRNHLPLGPRDLGHGLRGWCTPPELTDVVSDSEMDMLTREYPTPVSDGIVSIVVVCISLIGCGIWLALIARLVQFLGGTA